MAGLPWVFVLGVISYLALQNQMLKLYTLSIFCMGVTAAASAIAIAINSAYSGVIHDAWDAFVSAVTAVV